MKNEEMRKRLNSEICVLCESFGTLATENKKSVLKTARGLLRIQKAQKAMISDNTWHGQR
jgi:hypothetical protein